MWPFHEDQELVSVGRPESLAEDVLVGKVGIGVSIVGGASAGSGQRYREQPIVEPIDIS